MDCGTLCFQESERDLCSVGLIGKKMGWHNGKKYRWAESGICVCVCVCEKKNNSFEIHVIIFKVYKKCKSPIKKGF